MVGTRVAHDQVNQAASKSAHATQAYDGRMGEIGSGSSEVIVHRGGSLERKHEVVRGPARLRAVSRAAERQRHDERIPHVALPSCDLFKLAGCIIFPTGRLITKR